MARVCVEASGRTLRESDTLKGLTETKPGFPAPLYAKAVLAVNFQEAQKHFLPFLLDIHYAHTLMLVKQRIMPPEIGQVCLQALDELPRDALRTAVYDGKSEDLFFTIETTLENLCGPENAGWMHTARSRNDIGITLYRMHLRREILHVLQCLNSTRKTLLTLAQQHTHTLMPAYTHTQPAQPITFAHYLAGVLEMMGRDEQRLQAAFATVNRSPMGACAISTTGFPIDREYTAELLAFDGLQLNSYGAIAATDYLTETAGVIATAMINLGRVTQDFLLWCTAEFGFLRLSDAWVQISSIMPQKRNPVPFEHVRALASKALSQAQGILIGLHNTPWGDINDAEDDLQPLVSGAMTDAIRALQIFGAVLKDCEVITARMAERAYGDFLTVTEVADLLVRNEGISFRQAHALVSATVTQLNGNSSHAAIADTILASWHGELLHTTRNDLLRALDPAEFVRSRRIPGGPAEEPMQSALAETEVTLSETQQWIAVAQQRLDSCPDRISEARHQLLT